MKCVIIGGGGFLGSHISDALLAENHDVRVFDRREARYLEYCHEQGAEIVTGDPFNSADTRGAISNCEVVYHLVSATVPQSSNDNPQYDVESNVLGSLRLLDEVRKVGVKKVIFASSGGTVYGIPQQIPIPEDHATDPITSYAICKLMIEKYLHFYWKMYGLDYCVLRIANAYGERQPITGSQGVIGVFLDQAFQNTELTVWGDGSATRDYVYAGDVARAMCNAALYPGETRIFNIGAGKGHSLNDIIAVIEEIVQRPLRITKRAARPFDVAVNVLDISRAKLHLHWQPTVGLFEGIERAYKWMLKEHQK